MFINMCITVFLQYNTTMRRSDQGAHIRERLTANRFDLTLQGGPNQHGTHKPRRTTRTNQPFPSPPRTTGTSSTTYSQPSPTRDHQK